MNLDPLLAILPVEQRLALAYAPRAGRLPTLAVLALDARLGGIVRSVREPLLAQMRLAWWRDRFAAPRADWPEGEPLLALARTLSLPPAALSDLVDGWEALVGQDLVGAAAFSALVDARSDAFRALAGMFAPDRADAVAQAARTWALADLASRLSNPLELAAARNLAGQLHWETARLPRALRALAVLAGLARRRRDALGQPLASRAGDLAVALRIGVLGL